MESVELDETIEAKIRLELGQRLRKCRKQAEKNYFKDLLEEEDNIYKKRSKKKEAKFKHSQKMVTNALKINQGTLSRYERGEITIDIYTLCRLSILYRIKLTDFIPDYINNLDRDDLKDKKKNFR